GRLRDGPPGRAVAPRLEDLHDLRRHERDPALGDRAQHLRPANSLICLQLASESLASLAELSPRERFDRHLAGPDAQVAEDVGALEVLLLAIEVDAQFGLRVLG